MTAREQTRPSRWISVEERLPLGESGVGGVFLVWGPPWVHAMVAGYDAVDDEWFGLTSLPKGGITHWMPLPSPPVADEEEGDDE